MNPNDWSKLLEVVTDPSKFGALALGIFVGWLLGFGLKNSGQNLRATLTVLGAALGGGPVLFLRDAGQAKWMYPIGLLLGLLYLRILDARDDIVQKHSKPSKRASVQGWFAWLDLVVIFVATAAAVIYVVAFG